MIYIENVSFKRGLKGDRAVRSCAESLYKNSATIYEDTEN